MRPITVPLSLLAHVSIAGLVMVSWPEAEREIRYVPPVPVDVITEAEIAAQISVPEERAIDEPEAAAPQPEEPAPVEEAPPPPVEDDLPPADEQRTVAEAAPAPAPVPQPDPEPAPVDEAKSDPEPVPEPKPETPPKPKPKPAPVQKPAPDPLADLAGLDDSLTDLDGGNVKRSAPSQISRGGDTNRRRIGSGAELTLTEEAYLRACIERNWSEDRGALNWEDLVIEVQIDLNIDGSLARAPEVLNDGQINRSRNRSWAAARLRALQSIDACVPFDRLDPARYAEWRSFTYNFDPEDF